MGSHKNLFIVSAVALMASAFSANAADYIPEPPIVELPPVEHFGGWYLRGDIGYASISVDEISYFQGASQTGRFEIHEFEETWMIGAGVGYQINQNFRVDWTLDYYASTDFTGSSALNVACSDGTVGAICSYSDNSSFSATTFLANAYVDIGNWHGFTPYVGAGVGGAYVTWDTLNNVERQVSGATATTYARDTHAGESGWRFAYGLHAGASYDLSANLKIDAGYSYTNIAEGEMVGFGSTSGLAGTQAYHGEMEIHTFRLGLRYQIW